MSVFPFSEDSLSVQRRVEAACNDFEKAWQDGGTPKLEEALAGKPDEVLPILFRELLPLDVYYRTRAGENPAAAEYVGRFPQWQSLIRDVFAGSRRGR